MVRKWRSILIMLCLATVLAACANNGRQEEKWPVDWFVYQGITPAETSMDEVKRLLGEPVSESYVAESDGLRDIAMYDYDGFSVYGLENKASAIFIKTARAPGLGGGNITVGSALQDVLAALPAEPKVAQVAAGESALIDYGEKIQDYGCYILETMADGAVVEVFMALRLGQGRSIYINFDEQEQITEISIGQGS